MHREKALRSGRRMSDYRQETAALRAFLPDQDVLAGKVVMRNEDELKEKSGRWTTDD
jgi:hypothetical protein